MKAEIIETKKKFEPIEIKLVIESEAELCDLLNRINTSPNKVQGIYLKRGCIDTATGKGSLFTELDRIAKRYDLVL